MWPEDIQWKPQGTGFNLIYNWFSGSGDRIQWSINHFWVHLVHRIPERAQATGFILPKVKHKTAGAYLRGRCKISISPWKKHQEINIHFYVLFQEPTCTWKTMSIPGRRFTGYVFGRKCQRHLEPPDLWAFSLFGGPSDLPRAPRTLARACARDGESRAPEELHWELGGRPDKAESAARFAGNGERSHGVLRGKSDIENS